MDELNALFQAVFHFYVEFVKFREEYNEYEYLLEQEETDKDDGSWFLGWNTKMSETLTLFRALSRWGPKVFHCTEIPSGITTTKDVLTLEQGKTVGSHLILYQKLSVVSFLRSATQLCAVSMDICIWNVSKSVDELYQRQHHGITYQEWFQSMQLVLWSITGAIEPSLFLDPRPFWDSFASRGGGNNDDDDDSAHRAFVSPATPHGKKGALQSVGRQLWECYARLFLLTGFQIQRKLRKAREVFLDEMEKLQHGNSTTTTTGNSDHNTKSTHRVTKDKVPFDLQSDRRPVRTLSDMGFGSSSNDEFDDADVESWPMSVLFEALAVLSDEWNRTVYTPTIVAFVARCLLRYSMIDYIRTSPEMREFAEEYGMCCVHDLPEYSVESVGEKAGWLGVNHVTYHGHGGSTLRDILKSLCVVSHTDNWVALLSTGVGYNQQQESWKHRSLAERLFHGLYLSLAENSTKNREGERTEEEEEEEEEEIRNPGLDEDTVENRCLFVFLLSLFFFS